MKKSLLITITSAFAVAVLFIGCGKQNETKTPTRPSGPVSAQKNSFQEVTSQLDPGGDLYLYLSTEQLLDGISGKVSAWRGAFTSMPGTSAEHEQIGKAFDVVTSVIKDSGIEDVSGFGASSIATATNFYHTKTFLHHYPNRGSGLLWNVFGRQPHALAGLDFLPTNTVFAMFSDADVPLVWNEVKKQLEQSGFPQAQQFLDTLPAQFEKSTGLNLEQVLNSLGGEFGVVLTLDDSKMIPVPIPSAGGGEPLQIPEPALMIVAKVKDATIFNRVEVELTKKAGQSVVRVDKPDLKMRTVALPLPLPIQLRPTIASSGEYLFIATTDSLIQEALAVKGGKPGLKSTDEFKRLAKDIPEQGNQFSFVSQRFGQTIIAVQRQVFSMSAGNQGQTPWFNSLLRPDKANYSYCVSANTDEGWMSVGNGNQHPAKMLVGLAAAPVAVSAAMLLPALAKAKSRAQEISCVNNLKQIGLAAKIWAGDHDDTFPPNFLAMTNELSAPKILVCPQDSTHHVAADWSSFNDSENCSYEYLAPSLKDNNAEPNLVVFRCPIHGNVCLADGSVQMGIGKTHPDWLVRRNGKLYFERPNGQ
jgi:hypothetical protein